MMKKIKTANMSREDWLNLRRHSIGGSDAAAIVGLNEYASPFSVWADKRGLTEDKPDNEAMRQGRDLEDYVAQRFCTETGKRVKRCNYTLYNPLYPFAHANIDRSIVGENAGLECKTTSALNMRKFRNGEFPANYYVQCMHYMAVTGMDKWYLAVLVLNKAFMVFEIERDEGEIAALMAAEEKFWAHVDTGVPPAPDGSKATTDVITELYAETDADDVVNLADCIQNFYELKAIQEQMKTLESRKNELQNVIKTHMGASERGECGDFTVTWKHQRRTSYDMGRLTADHPDIDIAEYTRTTQTRVFKISI